VYSFYLSLLKDSEAKEIVVLHGNVAWAAHYVILHQSCSKLRSLMKKTTPEVGIPETNIIRDYIQQR
jgi:hypothetical protein